LAKIIIYEKKSFNCRKTVQGRGHCQSRKLNKWYCVGNAAREERNYYRALEVVNDLAIDTAVYDFE